MSALNRDREDRKMRGTRLFSPYCKIPIPSQAMHYLILLFFSIFSLNVDAAEGFDNMVSTSNKPAPVVVQLTPKERAWLANHKRIRIAYDGSLPPYSFLNDSGQLEGIAIEVMDILSKRLGIKFDTYPNTVWNKLYKAAAEHKVDVVATMVNRPDRTYWFNFTQPYLKKSLVIMTKRDNDTIKNRTDLAGKKVTMVRGYQYAGLVIKEFPSIIPYYVDSMLDGLNAVSTEKADAAIIFMDTASYLQTKYPLTDLKFAAFYEHNSANESIAVRKDWPIMAVILQKALDTLSEEELQNIHAKWIPGIKPKPSIYAGWVPGIKPKPSIDYGLIWTIVAACIIVAAFINVLVLLIRRIIRVRRQNRKIKLAKSEDQATRKILEALQNNLEYQVLMDSAELNPSEHKPHGPVENPHNKSFLYQRDYSGLFIYISRFITNILRYPVDKFTTLYRKFHTDSPVTLKIDEYTKQCKQSMPNPPDQLNIYDAQKNIHWFEVKDTPVYDENGNCRDVDGVVHEITECKQNEGPLIRLSYYDQSSVQKSDRTEEKYRNPAESAIARQVCPRCGDAKTRRSSRRTTDGILRILFCKSYRCRQCRYRFWVVNPLRLALLGGILLIIAIIVGGMPFFSNEQETDAQSAEVISMKLTEKKDAEARLQGGLYYILGNKGIME